MTFSIKNILKNYYWAWLCLALLICFAWPGLGSWLQPYVVYLLFLLMFFGWLDFSLLKLIEEVGRDWRQQLLTAGVVFLVSPLLVLFLHNYLPKEVWLGLLLAALAPAGYTVATISNGRGNKYSVLTGISHLLYILIFAGVVWLLTNDSGQVSGHILWVTILKLVVLPLLAVSIVRQTKAKEWLQSQEGYFLPVVSWLLCLGIVSPVRDNLVLNLDKAFFLGLIAAGLIVINYIIGYLLAGGGWEKSELALTVANKNYFLSAVLVMSLFGTVEAMPSIIFLIVGCGVIVIRQIWQAKK